MVLFYFLLIRPQQKRSKQHKEMVASVKKGDDVATNGGLLGKVVELDDNFATLEIAKGGVRHKLTTRNQLLMPEAIEMKYLQVEVDKRWEEPKPDVRDGVARGEWGNQEWLDHNPDASWGRGITL